MIRGHFKLAPIPVARPWGGGMLSALFGKPRLLHGEPIGESWEAADVDDRRSLVASGPHAGVSVRELIGEPLPLLVKFIDAQNALSLQVHPDEATAAAIGRGAAPKTEAWHVLSAQPFSWVVLGLAPGTSVDALIDACRAGAPAPLLRKVPVFAGDTIFVPAGTVHAIGPNLVFYEVQQPGDTTYRVYDWGHMGLDGKPRALHIDEARRSIKTDLRPEPKRAMRGALAESSAFRLDAIDAAGPVVIEPRETLSILTATSGKGRVRSEMLEEPLAAGDTFLLTAGSRCEILHNGGLRLLDARPGERR